MRTLLVSVLVVVVSMALPLTAGAFTGDVKMLINEMAAAPTVDGVVSAALIVRAGKFCRACGPGW